MNIGMQNSSSKFDQFLNLLNQHNSFVGSVVGRKKAVEYATIFSFRKNLLIHTESNEAKSDKYLMPLLVQLSSIDGTIIENNKSAKNWRKEFTQGCSRLLDLLDQRSLLSAEFVLSCAQNYRENSRNSRARNLLRNWIKENSDDQDALLLLATLLEEDGDYKRAEKKYTDVITKNPKNAAAWVGLGCNQSRRRDYSAALKSLNTAQELEKDSQRTLENIAHVKNLQEWHSMSAEKNAVPTIEISANERENGYFRADTLSLAAELYRRFGTLYIPNLFDPQFLKRCCTQFLDQYQRYFKSVKHTDALQIGDRRLQVTLSLEGVFNNPELYANPFLVGLMNRLLDNDVVVGSMVFATSLPGAKAQHLHKDNKALFCSSVDDDPRSLPPVSVTTMIPLVSLDEKIGSTQVVKRSHRYPRSKSARMPVQTPIVPLGGCFLMDCALSHKGMANQTEQVRPIINMVYHRSWFIDSKNFAIQPPLQLSTEEFNKIPKQHRPLFQWTQSPRVDSAVWSEPDQTDDAMAFADKN